MPLRSGGFYNQPWAPRLVTTARPNPRGAAGGQDAAADSVASARATSPGGAGAAAAGPLSTIPSRRPLSEESAERAGQGPAQRPRLGSLPPAAAGQGAAGGPLSTTSRGRPHSEVSAEGTRSASGLALNDLSIRTTPAPAAVAPRAALDFTDQDGLLAAWKRQQEELRGPLVEEGLIRQQTWGFMEDVGSDGGRSVDAEISTPIEGDPVEALTHAVQMPFHMAAALLSGTKRIGDDCRAEELQTLGLPWFIEEIGDNFSAPKLAGLSSAPSVWHPNTQSLLQHSRFQRFGDNVAVPSLQKIKFKNHQHFVGFGRNFQAPSLTTLTIGDCPVFSAFPEDFHLPSLVSLDLKGCGSLQALPARFFDGLDALRNIELLGTRVRFNQLPAAIRNNPAIHIDIRPVADVAVALGGAQSTHVASVHFSTSESARRIVETAGTFDVDYELLDLRNHVDELPAEPVPEGLQPYVDGPLPELLAHVRPLEADHPHKRYFTSEVNAAKRALFGQLPHQDAVERNSQVGMSTYLAASWRLMKDPDQRCDGVELDTGREQFVRMLYEIQRGYNLKGEEWSLHDDGDPRDMTICFGGAFNKVTDRMNGILKAAVLIVLTDSMLQMKTDAVIKERIRALIDDGMPLTEFTEPDADDAIHCSPELAQRVRAEILGELSEYFRIENEPSGDTEQRTAKIAGFLDYQLPETDMSELVRQGKGKAVGAADA
jgi:hypothetical protein